MDDYTTLERNPILKQDIEDTVDYLLMDKSLDLSVICAMRLLAAFIMSCGKLFNAWPQQLCEVVVVSEQSFLGYF